MKDDGAVYGPATLDQLREWALSAKIPPLDRVSNDEKKSWRRAPMISDLHMDWLVEVTEDFLYGPTTFGTVQEFLTAGEIDGNTVVINCREGNEAQIKDMPMFNNSPRRSPTNDLMRRTEPDLGEADGNGGTENQKLLRLERAMLELRLALNDAESRYQKLRKRFIDETGREP